MKKFILLLLIFMLTGCSMSISAPSFINRNIEEISIPIKNFDTINPFLTKSIDNYNFLKNIYDSLYIIDENGNPVPSIVDVEYSEDNLSINMKFNDNYKFHNNSNLTSEDIEFTIQSLRFAMINYDKDFLSNYIYSISNIKDITIISDDEFIIIFKKVSPLNLYSLTFPIISKKNFNSFDDVFNNNYFITNGTGAYSMSRLGTESYEIDLNNKINYKPKKIIGKFYKNNLDILHDFESEQVNFTIANKFFVDKMKNNGNIKGVEFVSNEYEYIIFSEDSNIFKGEDGKFFRNILDRLLDKNYITDRIYSNMGVVSNLPIRNELYYEQESSINKEDIEDIKNNLILQGYQDMDEDGLLEDLEGRDLSVKIIIDNNPYREAVAEYIKNILQDIGIESNIDYHTVEINKINSINDFNRLNEKKYDILIISSVIEASPYVPEFIENELKSLQNQIYDEYKNLLFDYENSFIMKDASYIYDDIYRLIDKEKVIIGLFYHKYYLITNNNSISAISPNPYNPYKMAK